MSSALKLLRERLFYKALVYWKGVFRYALAFFYIAARGKDERLVFWLP
jgi:hypothetical protein